MTNHKRANEIRMQCTLDRTQRAFVIGTLLGDGCLVPTAATNSQRLQVDQSEKQRAYVTWKYQLLKPFVLQTPVFRQQTKSWRFRTISHPDFTQMRSLFYRGTRKIVPDSLQRVLTEPLSLAVWFMDDGSKNRNDGLILNTQSFLQEEVLRLKGCLSDNFGIHHVSLHADKNGWRLYIQKASADLFTQIIKPYVLECLAYKLISPVETTRQLPA